MGEEDISFSPLLASISLVFHHPQSAGGQAAQAAGVRQLLLPTVPPLFLLPTSCSSCPSKDQEWSHRHVPSDGPFPDVSFRLLVAAALPKPYWHPPWGTPRSHSNPLTPQSLTDNKTPEARAVVISEVTLRALLLNQQNKEKRRQEAKTRIAQASPKAAAAGLLTHTTSARLGFCKQLILFFPDKISFSYKIQLSRWVFLVWGKRGGVLSMGKMHWQSGGKGPMLNLLGLQLAEPHQQDCEFCARKSFRVMLQK